MSKDIGETKPDTVSSKIGAIMRGETIETPDEPVPDGDQEASTEVEEGTEQAGEASEDGEETEQPSTDPSDAPPETAEDAEEDEAEDDDGEESEGEDEAEGDEDDEAPELEKKYTEKDISDAMVAVRKRANRLERARDNWAAKAEQAESQARAARSALDGLISSAKTDPRAALNQLAHAAGVSPHQVHQAFAQQLIDDPDGSDPSPQQKEAGLTAEQVRQMLREELQQTQQTQAQRFVEQQHQALLSIPNVAQDAERWPALAAFVEGAPREAAHLVASEVAWCRKNKPEWLGQGINQLANALDKGIKDRYPWVASLATTAPSADRESGKGKAPTESKAPKKPRQPKRKSLSNQASSDRQPTEMSRDERTAKIGELLRQSGVTG